MFRKLISKVSFILALLVFSISLELKAEINFDFALPLFKQEEINFEKTKTADYNLQLLKKYILEHNGNVIAQYHAISRWFTLIKLSDTPRHAELLAAGNKYFSTENKKNVTAEEKLREIFYTGILLSTEKESKECKSEQKFEDLLLEYDEDLHENPNYWIAKGIIFQVLKSKSNNYFDLMKPEEDLKTALTLIPRNAQYYYLMGQCFRFLGSTESSLFLSIASYEKASSLDPRNQKLQNSLLSIYMGLHEEYQAKNKQEPFWLEEAVYKKILDMAPANPHALNNLGYLYAEYGVNTQTAMELCQRAVELSPENPGFYDSLGWAAFKNRNYKLAEEALTKSISLRDNVYESHYHLATLYYSLNQYSKAAEQYEKSIKLRPDSAEALNNLAYLYTEENKNIEKALSMAITANKLEPNNASYLDTLGWSYYRVGDLENALNYLQKADALIPGQGEILLHIGRVYLDQNNFDKALTYVKEAFKANPNQNDPDETLYLTIRLKAYHEAMADYHGLLGEKADKEKVLNILMGISRLYQEEGLYEKSIEITRICSDLKNNIRTLSEPLLDSYKLYNGTSKTKDEKATTENEDEIILEPEEEKSENTKVQNDENLKQTQLPSSEEEKNKEPDLIALPTGIDYPLAINFCTDFFKTLSKYCPYYNKYSDCNVTIIMDRLLKPQNSFIRRISSKSLKGEALKDLILKKFKCLPQTTNDDTEKDSQVTKYKFYSGEYYCTIGLNGEVYFSKQYLDKATLASLSLLLPYKDNCFMELYYDNTAMQSRILCFFRSFVNNPIEPFQKIQATYSFEKEGINEFIIGSTGKVEQEDFMKKMARRLFQFKLDAKQNGLETTIKMQSEKENIYISTDFENLFNWLQKKVDSLTSGINNLIPFIKRALH